MCGLIFKFYIIVSVMLELNDSEAIASQEILSDAYASSRMTE